MAIAQSAANQTSRCFRIRKGAAAYIEKNHPEVRTHEPAPIGQDNATGVHPFHPLGTELTVLE
jgi:hypothetical protein